MGGSRTGPLWGTEQAPTPSSLSQRVARVLWDQLNKETQEHHVTSVELFYRLHCLAPTASICEDIICHALLHPDKVSPHLAGLPNQHGPPAAGSPGRKSPEARPVSPPPTNVLMSVVRSPREACPDPRGPCLQDP